ncbi:hypothetical protein [Acinetobacter venetianus]|uniref:hypothetical protein n=1 Tax=Acinetobacter venetianus TaxID=52133 RepID=UPI0007784D62|nr:hypothetical protein [Acinetobacter venetianus]KXZ66143.1 hypothetical protein AVENLUH7437_01096 [Acinetobacter venetianus]
MTFERKKIWGEQLEQLAGSVEPLLQELDLDLPIKQECTLLVDEERSIYYLSFFTGSGYLSPKNKFILEKEGPYLYDDRNPVTPDHWPTVEALVTPTQAILFTSFEFSLGSAEKRRVESEFYISSLSIKSLDDSNIIRVRSEDDVPKNIHDLISEAFYTYQQREGWTITTQLYYNLDIDMLKGLRNDND